MDQKTAHTCLDRYVGAWESYDDFTEYHVRRLLP
jgi:hypothetical protein